MAIDDTATHLYLVEDFSLFSEPDFKLSPTQCSSGESHS